MRRSWIGPIFSVTLHALLVAALTRFSLHVRRSVESPRATIIWLASRPLPSDVSAALTSNSDGTTAPPRERVETDSPATRVRPATPAAPESGAQAPANGPAPLDGIDLAEERQRAAKEVLEEREKAKSYRSHAFVGTIAEQEAFDDAERLRRTERGLQQPLTAFDSPSKGRAGLRGKNALGESLRWVSDDCYEFQASPSFSLPDAAQYLLAIPQTICARPLPRGDLFATAKPTYLMNEEERATAEQVAQRLERLRRPTTGVAMPLSEADSADRP